MVFMTKYELLTTYAYIWLVLEGQKVVPGAAEALQMQSGTPYQNLDHDLEKQNLDDDLDELAKKPRKSCCSKVTGVLANAYLAFAGTAQEISASPQQPPQQQQQQKQEQASKSPQQPPQQPPQQQQQEQEQASNASTVILARPMGFRNYGTNCFMNTALQCIAYLEPFQRFFTADKIAEILDDGTNGKLPDGTSNTVEPTEHFKNFLRIRQAMLKGEGTVQEKNGGLTVPNAAGSAFAQFHDYVRGDTTKGGMGFVGQQDAADFLNKFMQNDLSSLRPTTTLFPPRELIWPTQKVVLSECEEQLLRTTVDICNPNSEETSLAAWSCEGKIAETVVQNLQLKAGEQRVLLADSPVGRFLERVSREPKSFEELDHDFIDKKNGMCALFIASMDKAPNNEELGRHKAFLDSDPLQLFRHLEDSTVLQSSDNQITRRTELSTVVSREREFFEDDGTSNWNVSKPEVIEGLGSRFLEYVNFGDILVVNVKRAFTDYSSEDFKVTRLNFNVVPEETLELPVYGTEEKLMLPVNRKPTRHDVYKLKSIGLNSGDGNKGHWWAMAAVPSPDGKDAWWVLNDERIGKTELSTDDKKHVTLMFYVRERKGNQEDEEE